MDAIYYDKLKYILKDEDSHIDSIEAVQDQITQMGIQIFLSAQNGYPVL